MCSIKVNSPDYTWHSWDDSARELRAGRREQPTVLFPQKQPSWGRRQVHFLDSMMMGTAAQHLFPQLNPLWHLSFMTRFSTGQGQILLCFWLETVCAGYYFKTDSFHLSPMQMSRLLSKHVRIYNFMLYLTHHSNIMQKAMKNNQK